MHVPTCTPQNPFLQINKPPLSHTTTTTTTTNMSLPPLSPNSPLHHNSAGASPSPSPSSSSYPQNKSKKKRNRKIPAAAAAATPRPTKGTLRAVRSLFRSLSVSRPSPCRLPSPPLPRAITRPSRSPSSASSRTTGTLFGHRKARIALAIQDTPQSPSPSLLLELAVPTGKFMQEMAADHLRVALECDKRNLPDISDGAAVGPSRLLDEPLWTAYFNGRKAGYAVRRDPTDGDLAVARLLRTVSAGPECSPLTLSATAGKERGTWPTCARILTGSLAGKTRIPLLLHRSSPLLLLLRRVLAIRVSSSNAMLALRRAANITRSPSTHRFVARAFCANLGVKNSNLKHFTERASHIDRGHASTNHFPCGRSATCLAIRNLCSQSGASTDLRQECGKVDKFADHEGNKQLLIEQEIPNDESEADEAEAIDNVLRVSNDETDFSISKKFEGKYPKPPLFKVIMEASWESLSTVLNIWVEEGNSLGRDEISVALHGLRKRQLYGKALQFVEWLETTKRLNFVDHDYAYHLDLIAKVHGVEKAERYIGRIPESFKTEAIYEALLTNYVSTNNVKKAEEVFNKIRDLSLPVTIFSCNRLLLLYIRHRRNKIADLLTMMEKENVKPSLFTYKLLIDLKGRSHDIAGMENIIETMKMNGVEPDVAARALVASHYIVGGLNDKAEKTLKEMEGEGDSNNRNAFKSLLPLYAALGRADDVKRIWKLCEENPTLDEFSADGENGCRIGPLTWDALVKLYVKAGEVEKAESILQKVVQGKKGDRFMARGMAQYKLLLEAYRKAEKPAYGFRERMRSDNMYPGKQMLTQLEEVDAYKKRYISESIG
uniref:Pentacotripeptide-repeat region of PRORP domain-containing protein n=1 Tax=Ananas comosus var. bracteatus TaxID=296719 RepID=A0A6V7NTW7_ANACO|nr:unnamed protein product [Ananas comosus var. bracteatus]